MYKMVLYQKHNDEKVWPIQYCQPHYDETPSRFTRINDTGLDTSVEGAWCCGLTAPNLVELANTFDSFIEHYMDISRQGNGELGGGAARAQVQPHHLALLHLGRRRRAHGGGVAGTAAAKKSDSQPFRANISISLKLSATKRSAINSSRFCWRSRTTRCPLNM